MRPRHAVLLTEHAAKHAHPERASRAEGSLLAGSLPIPAHPIPVAFSPTHRPRKFFRCNTYVFPRIWCKQKSYGRAKSFRCNTYKKHGGGGLSFPFWISSLRTGHRRPRSFFSCTYALPILQLLSFHTHACNGGGDPPSPPRRPARSQRSTPGPATISHQS